MQASNAPSKSSIPFAESGTKNTIPEASQIGITPGLASFTDGFPPLTMTPLAAGGVPPYGADFNGILNFLSAATRWSQAGGGYIYDAAFATAVGGYPKGAILRNAANSGSWMSTVDNNTSNPDTGGAGWIAQPAGIATQVETDAGTNGVKSITPQTLKSSASMLLMASGYLRLPSWLGGLTLQWGFSNSIPSGSSVTVTYPVEFQNQTLIAIAGLDANATAVQNYTVACGNGTKTTLVIYNYSTLSASTRWIAIGY